MNWCSAVIVAITFSSGALAQGAIQKCVGADGKVNYQDYPCGESSHHEWQDRKRAEGRAEAEEKLRASRAATKKAVDDINSHYPPPSVTNWAALYEGAEKQRKENDAAVDALKPGGRLSSLPQYVVSGARTTETQSATHKHVDYCMKFVGHVHLYAINDVVQSKSVTPGSCPD